MSPPGRTPGEPGRAQREAAPVSAPVSATTNAAQYGAFHCDGMALALPVSALREAVPLGPLLALPCAAPFVVGGFERRGQVLPVLDLALVLGRDGPAAPRAHALVVAHAGRLAALAVDTIDGIFTAAAGEHRGNGASRADVGAACLHLGALQRADLGVMVQELSPQALLALPGLPWVAATDGPEPGAGRAGRTGRTGESAPARPVVLLHCGALKLAIDALAVQSTLAAPAVHDSALARGHCRGVIEHAGRSVPAVDLRALCGFGRQPMDPAQPGPAVVLALEAGLVALLVDSIDDVRSVDPAQRVALSPLGLAEPALFEAALSLSAAEAASPEEGGESDGAPWLLLSAPALRDHELLQALAGVHAQGPGAGRTARAGGAAASTGPSSVAPRVVSFMLDTEFVVPIDGLEEILRCPAELTGRCGDSRNAGLMVSRGRSIPVLDLCTLAGLPAVPLPAEASVLVVRLGAGWAGAAGFVGFAVPALKSIETVRWTPPAPATRLGARDSRVAALGVKRFALLGDGDQERVVHVLDLQALAGRLLCGEAAAA